MPIYEQYTIITEIIYAGPTLWHVAFSLHISIITVYMYYVYAIKVYACSRTWALSHVSKMTTVLETRARYT